MRPLELRLRNFRSYFGPETVFDLRGRSLVGVVGPIGSGKSTVLDAVSFALYGRTPAGGASTRALIHQRAGDGAVRLRFDVDGEIWEVVRSLRQKGQSQHALYRYPEDSADAERIETITNEREVNERVRELLGLDFDAFGRSVLLAQNRFAQFLTGGAADRDAVLKGVFGHDRLDRMRQVAKDHSAEMNAGLARIEGKLEQIEILAARLVEREAELAGCQQRQAVLEQVEPEVAALDERIAAAGDEAGRAQARHKELTPLGDDLPTPGDVIAAEDALATAAARRDELAQAMEDADVSREATDESLAALDTAAEQESIDAAAEALASRQQRYRRLEEVAGEHFAVTARLASVIADRQAQAAAAEVAAAVRAAAEVALDEARDDADRARAGAHEAAHRNMAIELLTDMAAGDTCPVCHQHVAEPPLADAAPDLAAAREEEAAATAAARTAESALAAAVETANALQVKLAGLDNSAAHLRGDAEKLEREQEGLEGEARDLERALVELLGEGDPREMLDARRSRLAAARAAAAEAARRFDTARRDHGEAIGAEQRAEQAVTDLQRVIDRVAVRLDLEPDGGAGIGVLAATVRNAWEAQVATARQEAEAAEDELAGAGAARTTLLEELGVAAGFGDELAAARATVAQLGKAVAADRAEIAGAEVLVAEQEEIAAGKARYDLIAADLTNTRFIRYLLDDERARLAELGGEHFMRLSSGRYRFTDDGAFDIVDLTAADAIRKATSLSGGETFLASLALALALAEMVTRTGGRLDAFFLDEGFGSLDAEHLDLAMEGIEELVAEGSSRLVVVVSHVPEMRERIEDLIVLDRDPLTGDTKVVRA